MASRSTCLPPRCTVRTAEPICNVRERLCSHVDVNFCRQLPAFLRSYVCCQA